MQTRVVALFAALMLAPLQSSAGSGGVVTFGGSSTPEGCTGGNCHPEGSPGLTTQLSGPGSVSIGTLNQYTMSVAGVTALQFCGINIAADSGSLMAAPPWTQKYIFSDQLTHTQPTQPCSFTFGWVAPGTPDTYYLRATAVAGNSNGNRRDDTAVPLNAFPITVLPEPSPNMLLAIAVATLTLASGGRAPEQRPLRRTRRRRWSTAHRGASHSGD